jgi:archaeosine synthase beta-subunit
MPACHIARLNIASSFCRATIEGPRLPSSYPTTLAERDTWILARRRRRNALDPFRPYGFHVEHECAATGEVVPVATIFLTNRECPWHCLMCDLWQNTLASNTPHGAIPAQIDYALERLPPARQIKLYNSGSFFDRRAIPLEDHASIADHVTNFERIIVECHPALVSDDCRRFRDMLNGKLEVAMGLETVHPEILSRLNKRMTVDQFAGAADLLRKNNVDLRVFILVKPPFMREGDALEWAARSLEFAFDCGATAATLIPTRGGNGAMEELAASGDFSPPTLAIVEAAAEFGIGLNRGRVFTDLWDLRRSPTCEHCHEPRMARLHSMNLGQSIPPSVVCEYCRGNR